MFDDIREKLKDWQEPGPEGLWEKIEAASGFKDSMIRQDGRKSRFSRTRPALRTIVAVSAAVAAAAALLFLLILPLDRQQGNEGTGTMIAENIPGTVEDIGDKVPSGENSTAEMTETETADRCGSGQSEADLSDRDIATGIKEKQYTELNSRGPQIRPVTAEGMAGLTAATDTKPYRVHDNVAVTAMRREDLTMAGTGKEEKRLSNYGSGRKERTISAETDGDEKGRRSGGLFSVGISTSNSPGGSSSEYGYTRMTGHQTSLMAISPSNPTALWIDPDANICYANQGEEVRTDTRYRLPVRTGITLRYQLPVGVGFETGITYTWLSSTLRSGSEESHYSTTTTLHYVGIPLNVSYMIWNSRFMGIYASAGGLMEKCIGGTSRTGYSLNGEPLGTDRTEKLSVKPLQWAVNATAGVQFNITKAIGIYAEPGIAYYFNDGTDLQTVYKAKPFNFYLRFGLRFSLDL